MKLIGQEKPIGAVILRTFATYPANAGYYLAYEDAMGLNNETHADAYRRHEMANSLEWAIPDETVKEPGKQ